MSPAEKGSLTEAILLAELLKRCFIVLKPVYTHARYDLVIELDGQFKKIQCKTGQLRNGRVIFNTHSIEWKQGRVAHHRHYQDDVDYFLVYCYENNESYFVPVGDAGKHTCSVRIEPTKNSQMKNVLWAKDYKLKPM